MVIKLSNPLAVLWKPTQVLSVLQNEVCSQGRSRRPKFPVCAETAHALLVTKMHVTNLLTLIK